MDTQPEFKLRTQKYKGFEADVRFSEEDRCYVGKVIGIRDVVTFTTEYQDKIEKEFKEAVDDYLSSF